VIERWNSEGIARHLLAVTLRTPREVTRARRIDSCLLCRRGGVNQAGLCEICTALVQDPEELELIQRWQRGEGP